DSAVANALDGFDVAGLMAALGARGDFQLFLVRHLRRFIHEAEPGTVNGHGFFTENVFASFDASPEVTGAKTRLRRQTRVVDAGDLECFTVGIEAAETFLFGHSEVIFATFSLLGKDISDGDATG